MFFKEDVVSKLDAKVAKHFFEIKLDSYGSLYPEKGILDSITNDLFQGDVGRYKDLTNFTMQRLFIEDSAIIKNNLKNIKNESQYRNLLYYSQ